MSASDSTAQQLGPRPPAKAALSGRIGRRGPLFLVLIFFICLAMPQETWISAGPLRLSPYRVVLIASFIPLGLILLVGRAGAIRFADVLIALHALWSAAALLLWGGLGGAWESAGIYIVELLGSYLLARCLIRGPDDFEKMIRFLFAIVIAILPFTLVEMLTGTHFIRDAFRAVLGGSQAVGISGRFGLERAFGPFDHPIHYGVFVASTLGLTYYVLGRGHLALKSLFRLAVVALGTFASLSTGPYLALVVQGILILWDRLSRGLQARWMMFGGMLVALYIMVDVLSNRGPIKVFISYFTLNAGSAYWRVIIWDYGTAEVARNPLFGIGLGDWQRPYWMHSTSMDNFWLVEAVRYGLPSAVLLGGAILWIATGMARLKSLDPLTARCRAAWLTTVVGLSVAGATVHFWGALFCLFAFLVGSGVWMLEVPPRGPRTAPAAPIGSPASNRAARARPRPSRPRF